MAGLTLLYGGSFDPVHRGHVETARAVQQAIAAERVLWLPAARSPLKAGSSAGAQRLELLRLALAEAREPGWAVDTSELDAPPPSYTMDTLKRWRERLGPEAGLAFLLGRDSLESLEQWRDWQALTDFAHLIVASRPGYGQALSPELENWLKKRQTSRPELLQSRPFGSVLLLDTPPWPIASSQLRLALTQGQPSAADWLPAQVWDYIQQHGLYRHTEKPVRS